MNEELLPFDINEYRADPSRLRHAKGFACIQSVEMGDCVVVAWNHRERPAAYREWERNDLLRLARKTRKVKVRLYDNCGRGISAVTEDDTSLITARPYENNHGAKWIGDDFEVEVPA